MIQMEYTHFQSINCASSLLNLEGKGHNHGANEACFEKRKDHLSYFNLLLPPIAPLVSCLMLGNLIRESGVIDRIADTIGGVFLDVITVFIAVAIGSTMSAASFVNIQTLEIVILGLVAFCTGTIGGILTGRVMCWMSKGKINSLIGSAGIAAVPMAARVSHMVGIQANRNSFLIMHAMGPNLAGVLGTAVAGGIMLTLLGVR